MCSVGPRLPNCFQVVSTEPTGQIWNRFPSIVVYLRRLLTNGVVPSVAHIFALPMPTPILFPPDDVLDWRPAWSFGEVAPGSALRLRSAYAPGQLVGESTRRDGQMPTPHLNDH